MVVEADVDPRFRNVTFSWTETDPAQPALDVLVRLIALVDNAHDDGDLGPYLLEPDGTGTWRGSVRLPADLRSSYQLCVVRDRPVRGDHPDETRFWEVFATGVTDPSNQLTIGPCTFGNPGSASVLELPDAPPQPWHASQPGVPAGQVTRHEVAASDDPSPIWIYTPPGYAPTGQPSPVAVLLDGRVWMDIDVTTTLDNLVAAGAIPPTVVAMVESIRGTTRMHGLAQPDVFLPFLLDELMPFVTAHRHVSAEPARTVLAGQSLGGLAATHVGLNAAHRFGLILTQSGSFQWSGGGEGELTGEDVITGYQTLPRVPVRFFQEAGQLERELLAQNRRLRDVLVGRGYDVAYREFPGGHDYACWRGGLADGLISLLGPRTAGVSSATASDPTSGGARPRRGGA